MSEKTEKDLEGKTAPPKKLYPVSDKDIKALRDKSENDTNSYTGINRKIINSMSDKTSGGLPVPSNEDVDILKKRSVTKTKRGDNK